MTNFTWIFQSSFWDKNLTNISPVVFPSVDFARVGNSERGDNWRLACAVGGLFSRGTKHQQKPVISLRSRSFRLSSPATQTRNNDVLTVAFKRIWVKMQSIKFIWNLNLPFYFSVEVSCWRFDCTHVRFSGLLTWIRKLLLSCVSTDLEVTLLFTGDL